MGTPGSRCPSLIKLHISQTQLIAKIESDFDLGEVAIQISRMLTLDKVAWSLEVFGLFVAN